MENLVKSRKISKEQLDEKYEAIMANQEKKNNERIAKDLAKVTEAFEEVLAQLKAIPFDYENSSTNSDSSDSSACGGKWRKKMQKWRKWKKGAKGCWKGWKKGMWKKKCEWKKGLWAKKRAFFESINGLDNEVEFEAKMAEWRELKRAHKDEWKEQKGEWKEHARGPWAAKKKFWKKKLEDKVQKQIDSTISQAVPQIALQVAQILNANQAHISNDLPEMKRIQLAKEAGLAIHTDFQCDSCGVCPIIGDCYKCSVNPDLDFCQQCEATVPHKYPFLKIRRPE